MDPFPTFIVWSRSSASLSLNKPEGPVATNAASASATSAELNASTSNTSTLPVQASPQTLDSSTYWVHPTPSLSPALVSIAVISYVIQIVLYNTSLFKLGN